MHYRVGSGSAPDCIAAIRGLLADDPDLAEVLGGREMRRNSRSGSSFTHSRPTELDEECSSRAGTARSVLFRWTSTRTVVGIKEIIQIADGGLEDRRNKGEIAASVSNPYVNINNVLGPVGA